MTQPTPLTDQQLNEIEAVVRNAALIGADIAPATAAALLDEVRRLRARVAELEPEADLLEALRAYGVDNWDGYDDAREAAASAVSGAADSRPAVVPVVPAGDDKTNR